VLRIDIGRFERVNQLSGTRVGDQPIVATAALIDKDREHDRVCRIAGHSLLVVTGDTGPRQALAAAAIVRGHNVRRSRHDVRAELELRRGRGEPQRRRDGALAAVLREPVCCQLAGG
jgi:GGDEF domain-containing protein